MAASRQSRRKGNPYCDLSHQILRAGRAKRCDSHAAAARALWSIRSQLLLHVSLMLLFDIQQYLYHRFPYITIIAPTTMPFKRESASLSHGDITWLSDIRRVTKYIVHHEGTGALSAIVGIFCGQNTWSPKSQRAFRISSSLVQTVRVR